MYDDIVFKNRGKDIILYPYITFIQPESMYLADRIIISEYTHLQGGRSLFVGSFSHIANNVSIGGGGLFIMEDFTGLAAGSRIITGTEIINDKGLNTPAVPVHLRAVERSYVHICKHSIVGANSVIHPGVTIGEGAIIGSCSMVNSDIEPWTINVGIPAKPIKERSNKEIKKLEPLAYEYYKIDPHNIETFLQLKYVEEMVPLDIESQG